MSQDVNLSYLVSHVALNGNMTITRTLNAGQVLQPVTMPGNASRSPSDEKLGIMRVEDTDVVPFEIFVAGRKERRAHDMNAVLVL